MGPDNLVTCKRKTRYSLEYLVPLWQRYKNLNASVQNLVTRFARNNDSSNPYLLLSKKKQTPVRMSVLSWQRYKDSNLK